MQHAGEGAGRVRHALALAGTQIAHPALLHIDVIDNQTRYAAQYPVSELSVLPALPMMAGNIALVDHVDLRTSVLKSWVRSAISTRSSLSIACWFSWVTNSRAQYPVSELSVLPALPMMAGNIALVDHVDMQQGRG
jgi:hypothetical protein